MLDAEKRLAGTRLTLSQHVRTALFCAAMGVLACVLYALTAQRGVSWQDSGEFQYKFLTHAYTWDVGSGLARLHPTYILITRAIAACLPFVPTPYVYALSSGIGMAVALCALSLTIYILTKSYPAACVAVVLLGGAQMAWWLSAVAEVYTWSLAFFMLELACLSVCLKRKQFVWFLGVLFFNGCHFGVHNFALLNLPVYAYIFLAYCRLSAWRWGACAAVWCLGAVPILIPIIRYAAETHSVGAVIQSVLFGNYFQGKVLNLDVRNGTLWLSNMALSCCSLFNPCWLYAVFALVTVTWRRRGAPTAFGLVNNASLYGSLLALTGIHFVFWFRYNVPDQATFILPTLGMLAVWAGIGAAQVFKNRRLFPLSVAVSIGFSVMAPIIFCRVAERYVPPRPRVLPFRDEFAYWAYPWKQNEVSAERFIAAVAKQVYPENMVLWVDTTAIMPLKVAQAQGRLPASWSFLTAWQNFSPTEIERRLRESPNGGYVLSPIPNYAPERVLSEAKSFERQGLLHRIVW